MSRPSRGRVRVIAVAGLVAVLVALGITGFVAPGFLVDRSVEHGSRATPPSSAGGAAGGEAVIDSFLDALNDGDIQSAKGMLCDATVSAWEIEKIEELVPKHASLHVDGTPEVTDLGGGHLSAIADLAGSWDDGELEGNIGGAFRQPQYADWCILSFTAGSSSPPSR